MYNLLLRLTLHAIVDASLIGAFYFSCFPIGPFASYIFFPFILCSPVFSPKCLPNFILKMKVPLLNESYFLFKMGINQLGKKSGYAVIIAKYASTNDCKIANSQSLLLLKMFDVVIFRYSANVSFVNKFLTYVCEHIHLDQMSGVSNS